MAFIGVRHLCIEDPCGQHRIWKAPPSVLLNSAKLKRRKKGATRLAKWYQEYVTRIRYTASVHPPQSAINEPATYYILLHYVDVQCALLIRKE
jgi:hypothetical protein